MNNAQTIAKSFFLPKDLGYSTIKHPQVRTSPLKNYILFSLLFWLGLPVISNFIASLKHQQFIARSLTDSEYYYGFLSI